MKIKNILAVGSALNDLLLKEEDLFLKELGREKGGMVLVDKSDIEKVVSKTQKDIESAPGGSACNTAVGLARLGADSRFLGKRGLDDAGQFLQQQLQDWGVVCNLKSSSSPTGQVMSIITPDAERTMMTHLGAASELNENEISAEDFKGIDLVHIEGYLLFNEAFCMKVFDLAKAQGCRISMDLSSFEVVRIFRDKLPMILKSYIDIIIANEDEAREYTGKEHAESLKIFKELAEMAIVKLGADGVLIAYQDEETHVPGTPVEAIDTTGAGDLWASGFLYGLTQGHDIETAARLGHRMGSEVVQVVGAVIPDQVYDDIKAQFNS